MTINTISPTPRSEFISGFKATIPLVIGGIPFGIIFGALAVTSGLSPVAAMAMSLFVFAGSAQFIAAGLVANGTGIGIIILTTFIVNLRHALYSTTLAPHMKHLSQKWLLPLGFWLTDESFVVAANRYSEPDLSQYKHWFFLGSAVFMYIDWQLCTLIGIVAGQAIPDPLSWGLDFAMVVTFLGLVVPMVKGRPTFVAVIVAGVVATAGYKLPNQLGLILAALLGVGAGVLLEQMSGGEEGKRRKGAEENGGEGEGGRV
jgi:4-azaleucine resistance transporter AzlC